ncbi:hypothetical protein ACFORJ_06500 [Corynebacterium hansenii]|uniref:Uncharacterized protein n=1 Tax=Corynebacterium hansenii TaxID=394964 RepID=A0ABV7ZPT9_9CORY|nr:hypothetical protein [Corynebacterium hansenii]
MDPVDPTFNETPPLDPTFNETPALDPAFNEAPALDPVFNEAPPPPLIGGGGGFTFRAGAKSRVVSVTSGPCQPFRGTAPAAWCPLDGFYTSAMARICARMIF